MSHCAPGAAAGTSRSLIASDIEGDRKCDVSPLAQVVVRARRVLLEHQRSCALAFDRILEDTRAGGLGRTVDLDLDGRVRQCILNPVGGATSAGQQIQGVTGGRVPDLDAVRPSGTASLGGHVAVVVGSHRKIVPRRADAWCAAPLVEDRAWLTAAACDRIAGDGGTAR